MKAKELIEKLSEFDENKEVVTSINFGDRPLNQDCMDCMDVMEFEDIVVIFTTH